MPLSAGTKLGRYEILAPIGAGGMGEVYRARDPSLNRDVAIKVSTAQFSERFEREAKAIAALNHPHICQVYDVGPDYLVMEFIEGTPLGGPLPVDRTIRYAVQICDALSAAHARGITHRDLKPANILVTAFGIKLLDFGLAQLSRERAVDATGSIEVTQAGTILGTAAYMSPEQAEGKTVDARSDIFSFGLILYEMLSGRRAFTGDSAMAIMAALLYKEPEPLQAPPALQSIVTRCLRKAPADRFQSAAQVKEALLGATSGSYILTSQSLPAEAPPSIAVLPFANMSRDADDEYFSDGLAEEIINALTQVSGLKVIARTSAFAFKGKNEDIRKIAETLGVSSVLEGSVRRAGSRLRITAQLIHAADGSHLWSQRYDRELTDIFAIQDDISGAIVESLKLRFSPSIAARIERPVNLEAYNLCLQGKFFTQKLTAEGLAQGVECYRQALALETGCAMAYEGLGLYYSSAAFFGLGHPQEALIETRRMAQKALELNESLSEAHACLGTVLGFLDMDWQGAEREFRRAIELNPQAALPRWYYAIHFLRVVGRLEEATAEMQRVVDLDPLSVLNVANLGWTFYERGLYDRAIELYRKAIELNPLHYMPHWMLAGAYYLQGKMEECLASGEKGATLSGRVPWTLGYLGLIHARMGRRDETRAILNELTARRRVGFITPMSFAICHIGLGEIDEAFRYLDLCLEERDPTLFWLREPTLAPIHGDARFGALLRKLNLEP